jgi:hypothetical protein
VKWNWPIWIGFALVLFGVFSYEPLFLNFEATRDFPWVNLLLFVAAGCFFAVGLRRAYAQPKRYRGRIGGPILAVISLALAGFACFGFFYFARNIPSANTALRVGQHAPDFTLTSAGGAPIRLSQLLENRRAVLLIFYRGYW